MVSTISEVMEAILNRRSVREFLEKEVEDEKIEKILQAARWAPSGLNNQPWKFVVIQKGELLEQLAELTHYSHILRKAKLAICVFLDREASYDRDKDLMALGAANQNMLLAAHSMGLGGVWLGQILARKEEVRELLQAPESLELMAVLALGHPRERERSSTRKELSRIAFGERYGQPL